MFKQVERFHQLRNGVYLLKTLLCLMYFNIHLNPFRAGLFSIVRGAGL